MPHSRRYRAKRDQNVVLTETFLPFLHWLTRSGSQKHHATRRGASQRYAWSEQLYAREGASLLLQVTIHRVSEKTVKTTTDNTGGEREKEPRRAPHATVRLRLPQQCSTMKLHRPAAVARQVVANKWQRMTKAYALPLRARCNLIILSRLTLFACSRRFDVLSSKRHEVKCKGAPLNGQNWYNKNTFILPSVEPQHFIGSSVLRTNAICIADTSFLGFVKKCSKLKNYELDISGFDYLT